MSEIPNWWLVLSGIFFAMMILVTLLSLFVHLMIFKGIKEVDKTIRNVTEQLNALIKEIQNVVHESGEPAKNLIKNLESVTRVIATWIERGSLFAIAFASLKRIFSHFMAAKAKNSNPPSQENR